MREPGSPVGGPEEGAAPAAESSSAVAASWPSTCPSAWPFCFFDFRFFFFPNMRACSAQSSPGLVRRTARNIWAASFAGKVQARDRQGFPDRKSTRLNSSHLGISYAVFCLKKKNSRQALTDPPRESPRARRRLIPQDRRRRPPPWP